MRSSFLYVAIVLIAFAPVASAQQQPQKRPNIVVILADDLGYSDLSCYGSEIPTPSIDAIARRGVRFTDFYNQSRCCPTRAALMTGQYPHQVGVGAMIDRYATWIRDAANLPSYTDRLNPESPTMAELLRKAGYSTIMCGKWHLGDRPEEWPAKRGFDRSFVLIPGAMNYWGGESDGPRAPMALDDKPFTPPHDGFFATDAFTDRAIEFVGDAAKQKDKPFFLYLAYNAPHWPLHAPPEDIEKFRGKYDAGWQPIREARFQRMQELEILDESVSKMSPMDRGQQKPWNELTDEQRREWALRMEIYAAQVVRMDENIGRLTAKLNELGVADDTLVLFLSDNGGAPEDPHRNKPGAPLGSRDSFWGYARPWATVSNTPWRNHKVTSYEGGISTPAVVTWPKGIPAAANGTLVRGPAHVIDLVPTFLALAGAEATKAEGKSIVPMIKGESDRADRTLCWEHEGNRSIRKGKWKLVMLADMPGWELFDLEADRIESNNLAEKHPEIVKELSADYGRWAERCGVVEWSKIEPHRPAPTTKPAGRRRG